MPTSSPGRWAGHSTVEAFENATSELFEPGGLTRTADRCLGRGGWGVKSRLAARGLFRARKGCPKKHAAARPGQPALACLACSSSPARGAYPCLLVLEPLQAMRIVECASAQIDKVPACGAPAKKRATWPLKEPFSPVRVGRGLAAPHARPSVLTHCCEAVSSLRQVPVEVSLLSRLGYRDVSRGRRRGRSRSLGGESNAPLHTGSTPTNVANDALLRLGDGRRLREPSR